MSVTLYHSDIIRSPIVRDDDFIWCFWQKSKPYKLPGLVKAVAFSSLRYCEVYNLGGSDLLWSGLLCDVPLRLKSYLTEVRVAARPAPALRAPSAPRAAQSF